MKTLLAMASAVILFSSSTVALASDFSFSINVGGPPVVITQPPDFLYPPELGYGVAVGVPYDMFYISGIYYIFRGGGWYRTTNYGGSWIRMKEMMEIRSIVGTSNRSRRPMNSSIRFCPFF